MILVWNNLKYAEYRTFGTVLKGITYQRERPDLVILKGYPKSFDSVLDREKHDDYISKEVKHVTKDYNQIIWDYTDKGIKWT